LHSEITKVPLFVRPPGGRREVVDAPVSTLDVAATVQSVCTGNESTPRASVAADTVSLLDSPPADRTVFSQARGEGEHGHLRRYAARTATESAFCVRNRESGEVDVTASTDQSVRSVLESHVEERVGVESGESAKDDDDVDEEIERRLEALGYKE
jgi:arylsulfatase